MEFYISNKRLGKIFDCANSVTTCSWTTNRTGSPGKFTFTIQKAGDLDFVEGDEVRFSVDGQLQFYGWVFTKTKDRWGQVEATCYDRVRYLKTNASYNFENLSAADMLRQIAADRQVAVGNVADTGYLIPDFYKEDESCLDIIEEALQLTLLNTGNIFVLYDDGNGLALQRPEDMISDVMIGERSLLTEYSYKTDIDSESYNSIKLSRPNEETGGADVVEAMDSDNIARWGLLQLYQVVDEALNTAQMQARAQATLSYYNRRLRTLRVESLGVPGLRAGMMVYMHVPGLGDINLDQYVLLEKVTHTWENDTHTMSFDTMAI